MKKWTLEEDTILKNLKSEGMSLVKIAAILNRSYNSIKSRSAILSGGSLDWSKEELETLSLDYTFQELSKLLGRSESSIRSKCHRLGIKKGHLKSGEFKLGNFDENLPTTLYLVDFGDFKKVGVCQVPIQERFRKERKQYKILDKCTTDLYNAMYLEREILSNMRSYLVKGDIDKGFYECFNHPATQLEDLL